MTQLITSYISIIELHFRNGGRINKVVYIFSNDYHYSHTQNQLILTIVYNHIFISCNSWIKEKNYFTQLLHYNGLGLMFVWLLRHHHIGVGATNTTINK